MLTFSSSAMARGWGANFTYGYNGGDVSDSGRRMDIETDTYGFGLTFDSNVAAYQLVNWRTDLNYERSSLKAMLVGFPTETFKGNGASINLAMGFGVVRTRAMRLWIGPTLRGGGAYYGEGFANFVTAEGGGGVDLGLNIHVGDQISVAGTIGYQYVFTYLTRTDSFFDQNFTGGANRVRVGVTVLFRGPGDRFE